MILVLVDIDGTIADLGPRLAHAGPEPARDNLQAFQTWLDKVQNHETLSKDEPVTGMAQFLRGIDHSCRLVYLTGRSEKYRFVTKGWLNRHEFPEAPLFMRNDTDWRTASDYKKAAIVQLIETYLPDSIISLDDDGGGDCSDMYKSMGIVHFKPIGGY